MLLSLSGSKEVVNSACSFAFATRDSFKFISISPLVTKWGDMFANYVKIFVSVNFFCRVL